MIRILVLLFAVFASGSAEADVRIKDIVDFDGVRGNDLVGYGLIVGLNGTGDGIRNSPFTEEILSNVLERLGVNITGEQFRPNNVAAVFVTAELPPFARAGRRIDVKVSAIGDAESLLGGTLILTPLNAADGTVYAVAQGSVIASGASVTGDAASITEGVPTSGLVPGGGRVEREVNFTLNSLSEIRLALHHPDFSTALRIETKINKAIGPNVARMLDPGTVSVNMGLSGYSSVSHVIQTIESLTVEPEQVARVVIDQGSGTIVLGEHVRVSRVAVSQGGLTMRVDETPTVEMPNPFADGETIVVPRTSVELEQTPGVSLSEIGSSTSLSDVVAGLNALGVSPRNMIDILKTLKAAGALHADLIVR